MFFVSLIIPTYNRCELLQRALESVYRQTCSALEVIVVDDGSNDRTKAMVLELFPDVRYVYQSNQGVSSARNKGLALAEGNWLALLDSDDEWLPNKLEKQVAALKSHPEYKVCHTEEIWVRNGVRVNQMKKHTKRGGWIFPHCLPLCAMSPSSVMIHHSVFEEVGYFDVSLSACEDYDLWLRITAKYPVLYIEQPQIIKYGGHEDQLSKQYWGMDRFRIKALQKIILANNLADNDKEKAIAMLIKKCKVFSNGAQKRGKQEQAQQYLKIIDQFSVKH